MWKHSGISVQTGKDFYSMRLRLNFVRSFRSSWLPTASLQDCHLLRELKLGYRSTEG